MFLLELLGLWFLAGVVVLIGINAAKWWVQNR